jgi:hypothetical protein
MSSKDLLSLQTIPETRTREHRVQFYESDSFLALAVADFLAPGISDGHPLVIIATEPHRRIVTSQLKSKGLDVDRASAMGHLTLLDARHTLDAFMVGTSPEPTRFRNVIGTVLKAAHDRGGPGAVLRLYGEMVDLLWRDGNTEGALQLEEMWNDGSTFTLTLPRSNPAA